MRTKSKNHNIRAIMLAVTTGIVSLALMSPAFAAAGDKKSVRAAEDQFYTALNSMFVGDVGPMEKVWSHADDVVYMGPDGGFEIGWKKVQANWKKQAALKLGGKVTPENVTITESPNKIAVVYSYEKGKNIDSHGASQPVSIRATNVFRMEGGSWKMIGHHTDIIPSLEKR